MINTHGMLTANQEQIFQIWPFLADAPPVLVDWLPWSHTFGGNHNFNMVLRHAGTLHVDAGRPLPSLVGETVRNLTEISPTMYFNVPAGYAAILPSLERDENFARSFFARLRMIFYAGAALPQDLWTRLEAASVRTTGERIPMTSSWGATETAPLATAAHFLIDRAGAVGVPAPGVEVKLVPSGAKLEIRVRGPNVMPGYWKRPDLTAAAFDAEGFYQPGDAVRFADPADAGKGIIFDGRLAEDFKLTSGPTAPRSRCSPGSMSRAARSSSATARRPRSPTSRVTRWCAPMWSARSRNGTRRIPARPSASRASCSCRTHRRSTPTRSPTRATSISASRSSGAAPRSSARSRRNRTPR